VERECSPDCVEHSLALLAPPHHKHCVALEADDFSPVGGAESDECFEVVAEYGRHLLGSGGAALREAFRERSETGNVEE